MHFGSKFRGLCIFSYSYLKVLSFKIIGGGKLGYSPFRFDKTAVTAILLEWTIQNDVAALVSKSVTRITDVIKVLLSASSQKYGKSCAKRGCSDVGVITSAKDRSCFIKFLHLFRRAGYEHD